MTTIFVIIIACQNAQLSLSLSVGLQRNNNIIVRIILYMVTNIIPHKVTSTTNLHGNTVRLSLRIDGACMVDN